jgi:hypothetical protein
MVNNHHPWLLVGPWYRWSDPYDALVGRVSRPVFQKFESSNFVNDFIQDPQHSLKYIDPDDFVRRPVEAKGAVRYRLANTGIRKIYLETHKRFYLVVCELHCDVPGFPSASRDEVCEAGFVVRRRVARIPADAVKEAKKTVRDIAWKRAQLMQLEELPPGMKPGAVQGLRAKVEAKFAAAQAELKAVATEYGISVELQGWFPEEGFQGVGSWQRVDETPTKVTEHIFPLYPLIPDPAKKDHSGGGRTLYFGVLPATSSDVDLRGSARFDDRSLYEVRCYVRRHDPRCPKKRERNDCRGEIVWSRRSESYQLANPFDLSGTSNRPINIFLPDLPALEAQAVTLKPGEGAPVRMIAPESSNIEVTVDPDDFSSVSKKEPGAAICSFSIPLITIVASFVFRLFLPIVMFVFGLWFLLKLKFCIPPSISIDAGVTAELDVVMGQIELDINVDIEVSAGLLGTLNSAKLPGTEKTLGSLTNPSLTLNEKVAFAGNQSADFSASLPDHLEVDAPPAGAVQRSLPSATSGLEYEERVEVKV